MKPTGNLLWKAIKDIRIDTLLTDCIIETLPEIMEKLGITTKKIPLTEKTIEELGDYLLPWHTGGTWLYPTNYRVKTYPKKIKLESNKEILITTIYDTKSKNTLIVDGSHRAVAVFQSKNKDIQGTIVKLSSEKARYIALKDFGCWREK